MGSAQIQAELWGQSPRNWASLQEPLHGPLWEAMLQATRTGPGTKLLDVGCGAGGLAVRAAEAGARVSGIDAVPAFVEIAAEMLPEGDFRVGDIEELPFADDSFDVVLGANSVQFAADPVAALAEIKRVCRAGGRIAVGVWGQAENCGFRHIMKAVAAAMPEPPKGSGPFALSAPGALEELLSKADIAADARGEIACPFDYPDIETLWRAQGSSGPFQGAMRAAGEERVKSAVIEAARRFVSSDGALHIDNTMVYVAATA